MSGGMLDPNEMVAMREWTLKRLRVDANDRIGEYTLRSARIEQVLDHSSRSLILQLRAEVLAEKTDFQDVEVPVAHEYTYDTIERGLWSVVVGAMLGLTAIAAFISPWAAVYAALVFIVAFVWMDLTGTLTTRRRDRWRQTVTVRANLFHKFPEIDVAYPPEFGRYVRLVTMDMPKYGTWEEEQAHDPHP